MQLTACSVPISWKIGCYHITQSGGVLAGHRSNRIAIGVNSSGGSAELHSVNLTPPPTTDLLRSRTTNNANRLVSNAANQSEKRRVRQAEIKLEKVALMKQESGNPNWYLIR